MLPIVIIGGGGHAKVVIDALRAMGRVVSACTDSDVSRHGTDVIGVPIEGGDDILDALGPHAVELALGVGVPDSRTAANRLALADELMRRGYVFPVVIHPGAIVARTATLGAGVQVMAGAVVQAATSIGDFAIVNTRASVDHDGRIGRGAHVAPGATLGGMVRVSDLAMIGLGASVLPQITVGREAMVAAGALVDRPVADKTCVKGTPAR